MLLMMNTLRRDATELSLLSSDQAMGSRATQRQVCGTGAVQVANHDVCAIAVRGSSRAASLLDINALFV
jgi:hypothetical protein